MRTVGPRLAAGLIAAGLVVAGCGGSAEPQPLPKPTASPSPSASTSPTPPEMPAAAKAKTKAGAEAFIQHYIQLVNFAGARGETRPMREHSLKTCVKCEALADGIDEVYSSGGRITGGGWTVVAVKHYGFDRGRYFLDVTIDSAPQQMVERAGDPEQRFPGAKKRLRAFVLERKSDEWRVSELDPTA